MSSGLSLLKAETGFRISATFKSSAIDTHRHSLDFGSTFPSSGNNVSKLDNMSWSTLGLATSFGRLIAPNGRWQRDAAKDLFVHF
jgi:hypothetical protein